MLEIPESRTIAEQINETVTEQRIPGLGNGVLQDILLLAGLHPRCKISRLTSGKRRKVYDVVQETLDQMTVAGGRDTEKDFFGTVSFSS